MRGLYWVRNDLRLHDNLTLNTFLEETNEGVILWCPTKSTGRAGLFRKNFLLDSLASFDQGLKGLGQHLNRGAAFIQNELTALHQKWPFEKIYFTSASSTEEKEDELQVIEFCRKHRLQWESFDQETLIFENDLPFSLESMPFIFSDFRKKIEKDLIIRPPVSLTPKRNSPGQDSSPSSMEQDNALLFHGGEGAAYRRLHHYFTDTKAILTYKETRNGMLFENDSTRLSPWLSLGILSPRVIIAQLQEFESHYGANESTYWLYFELFWRDYLKFFARKYQEKIFQEDGIKRGKHYASEKNKVLFLKWCEGKTEEPFINANINELNRTGWMSNRGRQNVASYLVHSLKIPWTWGAAYFERQLIDYDCELNWGNWLYLSGNGSDPRARIFNIKRQADVYDPESLYQKKWLNNA